MNFHTSLIWIICKIIYILGPDSQTELLSSRVLNGMQETWSIKNIHLVPKSLICSVSSEHPSQFLQYWVSLVLLRLKMATQWSILQNYYRLLSYIIVLTNYREYRVLTWRVYGSPIGCTPRQCVARNFIRRGGGEVGVIAIQSKYVCSACQVADQCRVKHIGAPGPNVLFFNPTLLLYRCCIRVCIFTSFKNEKG